MLGAAARTAWAGVPLSGYLAKPTEQLALPGSQASGEITPDGDVYTGWAEYELAVGSRLRTLGATDADPAATICPAVSVRG